MPQNEWNATLGKNYLWSNVNFGEAVTETMTPLSWSVLQFTLDDWIFLSGFPTVVNIGGSPYLNISVFASLFNALGRDQNALLAFMESTLYMQLPEGMQIPLIPFSFGAKLSGMANVIRMQMKQQRGLRDLPNYLRDNQSWFETLRSRIQQERTPEALVTLWEREIRPHIKGGVWTVLGTVSYASDYMLRLRRKLTDLVGEADATVLIANLSDDESGLLPSLEPLAGIAKVAKGEMPREEYLAKFGHRGPHEFELSKPRPVENTHWLEQELANFKANPIDIDALIQKQKAQFDAALERLSTQHPRQAKSLIKGIRENARRTRLREDARSAYVRDRWLIRLFALHAADLLGLGEDVFFLHLDELLDLLQGDKYVLKHIPTRHAEYEKFKALPVFPSIIRGEFVPIKWVADPNRRSDVFDAETAYPVNDEEIIRGAAGSAGEVEGIVRRLDSASEGASLKQGEILVTTLTDISWTPIFPRAAAVITDVGAPLSHAAIVARELGIPAVVGCGDATMRLKTGDRVRVNGGKGRVTIL